MILNYLVNSSDVYATGPKRKPQLLLRLSRPNLDVSQNCPRKKSAKELNISLHNFYRAFVIGLKRKCVGISVIGNDDCKTRFCASNLQSQPNGGKENAALKILEKGGKI